MAVFDISHIILGGGREDLYTRQVPARFKILKEWLNENVGEYYGRGEDPVTDVGSGWEAFVLRNGSREQPKDDEDCVVSWHIDIADDEKATLFALKWL